jgi:hypothetical protein
MTIAEELTAAGYGYRKSRIDQRREVYNLASGRVVGQLTAADAVEFLGRLKVAPGLGLEAQWELAGC